MVNNLVGIGLMAPRYPSEDRRLVLLTLTQRGKALTREIHLRVQEYEAALFRDASAEGMTVFVSFASKVMDNHANLAQLYPSEQVS